MYVSEHKDSLLWELHALLQVLTLIQINLAFYHQFPQKTFDDTTL